MGESKTNLGLWMEVSDHSLESNLVLFYYSSLTEESRMKSNYRFTVILGIYIFLYTITNQIVNQNHHFNWWFLKFEQMIFYADNMRWR